MIKISQESMGSSNSLKGFLVFMAIFTFSIQTTLASIACENLRKDKCAFAVSSSGKRCVLEKTIRITGEEVFICSTSEIHTGKLTNWIETDECLEACGLDRNILGISSDSLLESQFTSKLCSALCYNGCPNIVDLYFNLAVGEGVYLPSLCQARGDNKRRLMTEIRSSRKVQPGAVIPRIIFPVGVAPSQNPKGVAANNSVSVAQSPIPIGVTADNSVTVAQSPIPIGVTADKSVTVAQSPIPISVTADASPDMAPYPLPTSVTADNSVTVAQSPIPIS